MAYTKQTWADGSVGGTPLSAVRLNVMETGIGDAHDLIEYGSHVVRWNGTGWVYRGAVVTARPTNVPAWPDADVLWDTSLYSAVTTVPALAITGDKWLPHGSVTPSV